MHRNNGWRAIPSLQRHLSVLESENEALRSCISCGVRRGMLSAQLGTGISRSSCAVPREALSRHPHHFLL